MGREWKQRFEGDVELQRDFDQSRAVKTRNRSYCRFAYVRLVCILYSLTNHIIIILVQLRVSYGPAVPQTKLSNALVGPLVPRGAGSADTSDSTKSVGQLFVTEYSFQRNTNLNFFRFRICLLQILIDGF